MLRDLGVAVHSMKMLLCNTRFNGRRGPLLSLIHSNLATRDEAMHYCLAMMKELKKVVIEHNANVQQRCITSHIVIPFIV
jgi:hypothetical protein